MADGQYWMRAHHPGPCIAHDLLNLQPARRLVAMHRTFRAGRFILGEGAAVQPRPGIGQQLPAGRTQPGRRGLMALPAIQLDHRRDGFIFPLDDRGLQNDLLP